MILRTASCLLALVFFTACGATNSTARRQPMDQRLLAQNSAYAPGEPAPPAEGPEGLPANAPLDPDRNPGLLPTPLLRTSAASSL